MLSCPQRPELVVLPTRIGGRKASGPVVGYPCESGDAATGRSASRLNKSAWKFKGRITYGKLCMVADPLISGPLVSA